MIKDLKTVYQQDIILPSGESWNQEDMIRRSNCNWEGVYADDSGTDSILGKRPYDNGVVVARVHLEARSTDFSVSNIDIEPKNSSRLAKLAAIVQRKALQEWATTHNLAKLLDDIAMAPPRYGGVLLKKSKESVDVVPWENVITDQIDILHNPILERHYMTPSQLLKMKEWTNVREAIEVAATDVRDANVDRSKDNNQTTGRAIEVWELYGEITQAELKTCQAEMGKEVTEADDDAYTYVLAHVVKAGDLYLYADTIDELPYMFYARNPQTNRALGQSVFEQLREHQKWHNFTKTEEMRMIAIAGKVFYHTDDPDLFAKLNNVYKKGIDHGSVIYHKPASQFGQVNTTPSTLPAYQSIRAEWDNSANDITSSYASVTGAEQKSGTPFRAQALQNQMGSTQFTKYRNQLGEQLIRPMIEKWVLKMSLDELSDDLYAAFSPEELQFIDEAIVAQKQVDLFVAKTLKGEQVTDEDMFGVQFDTAMALAKQGNKRTLKGIKEFIKSAQTKVVIHVTDEMRNKAFLYESYANLLGSLAPDDPRREAILDRIMEMIGVSSEELRMYESRAQQMQQRQTEENPAAPVPAPPALTATA